MSGKHVILILLSLIALMNGDQGQSTASPPIESGTNAQDSHNDSSLPSALDSADPELVFVEARAHSVLVKMLHTGVNSVDITEVRIRCVNAPRLASTLEVVNRTDTRWTYRMGESPMDRCRKQFDWKTVEPQLSVYSAHTLFEVTGLQTDSKYLLRFYGTRHQWLNGVALLVSTTITVYTESPDPPFARTGYFYVEDVKPKKRVVQLLWQKTNSYGFIASYEDDRRRKPDESVIDFSVPSFATVQISTNRTTFRFQKLFKNGTRGSRSTFLQVPAHKDVLDLASWSPKCSWTGDEGTVEWDTPQSVTDIVNYTLVYIGQLSMYDTFEDPICFATVGAEEVRNITIVGPAPSVFGIIVHTNQTSSGLRVLRWTEMNENSASSETSLADRRNRGRDHSESATEIQSWSAVAHGTTNLTRQGPAASRPRNSTRSRGTLGRMTIRPV